LGGDGSKPVDKKERGKKKRKEIRREGNRRKGIRMKIKTIIENRKKKGERIMEISSSYTRYTTKISCFVKHLFKTISASPENLLYQDNHSRSCFSRSHSSTKCTGIEQC
jgi:hypothetical protein